MLKQRYIQVRPNKLKKGDTVGIISPSAPILDDLQDQFNIGVEVLKGYGLNIKIGEHVFEGHFHSAGVRENRILDFNTMWEDPEVKMVLMTQGGTTSNHLLDGIDYEMIKNNPKIFCGISDGTTLLNAIYARTGLVTYHGPDLLWTFGLKMSPLINKNIITTLMNGEVDSLNHNPEWTHQNNLQYSGWKCLKPGKAKGVLVGGHTGSILNLIVAGYMPNFKDTILFIEGTEGIDQLDKNLTSLRLGGVFEKISGLIVGWFDNCNSSIQKNEQVIEDLILEVTKGYEFPILEIGELGHNVENYIFPIGITANLDSSKLLFSFDESTVNF